MVKEIMGVPKFAIDNAYCVPSKPRPITKKKMKGGVYTAKRGGVEACPAKFKGSCCGGTKEWGVKEEDGPGYLDKSTGERNWFCYACGDELDHPTNPPRGSKGYNELARLAALKRRAEQAALAARIADAHK
jgi:hypothetical protein